MKKPKCTTCKAEHKRKSIFCSNECSIYGRQSYVGQGWKEFWLYHVGKGHKMAEGANIAKLCEIARYFTK